MTTSHNHVGRWVEQKRDAYCRLSDAVWSTPELCYGEQRSAAAHVQMLEAEGFRVTRNLAGLPTAMMGEWGEGGPVVAFLGEYDALAGLSQEAGRASPAPVEAGGHGHGCGHNLLGAGALLAAASLKDHLRASGLPGRVRYYGCPAEEGGSGKGFMVRGGVFAGVDVALTWHPGFFNMALDMSSLATIESEFTFAGKGAHAAAMPHLGRSALDAVELMNVGVNFLREHMPSLARIHYAIVDAGGASPNVVQPGAVVRYIVRASRQDELLDLMERVRDIARGAALMTGTAVKERQFAASASLLRNTCLEGLLHRTLTDLGPTNFDAADRQLAAEFQATLGAADMRASYELWDLPVCKGEILSDLIPPLRTRTMPMMGSTDVGDVSRVVPTGQVFTACYAIGTPFHTWQLVAQSKTPAAHKGMLHAAKALAAAGLELILDADLLDRARAEFAEKSVDDPYRSLIDADIPPRLAELV